MVRYYCDHCLEEMEGYGNGLEDYDTFYDTVEKRHVGQGAILCDKCYNLRIEKHIALDREFLHIEPPKGVE